MKALLLAVPLAPLAAALAVLVCGRRLPRGGGVLTACGTAVALVALVTLSGATSRVQGVWLHTAGFTLSVGLQLDGLSRFMALLVAGIALLVSVYAIGYMADEAGRRRFFAAFSFFVGAMLTLVLANSLVLLFAAWEGVGVASYLLIGFWYTQHEARRAAQKAFLVTRLGDFGFLLGWLLVLWLVGSTDLEAFLSTVKTGGIPAAHLTLLALLFLAGALGKSAQLPFTAWLPDAMVGPTPVSALIHSATMVAAGVYLVLRLFPLFVAAPGALAVVLWVGSITAVFAALVATAQADLKRILAWSTVSQLGEMMLALGLGGPLAAVSHLATHATFKATLFLAAGAVERAVHGRDLRQFGRLARRMPLTALSFGAAGLTLAGIPPLSGFWSEESILAQAVAAHRGLGMLMLVLVFLAGVYISRAGAATFAAWPGAPAPPARDPGVLMTAAMLVLALVALGIGWAILGQLEAMLPFAAGHEPGWGWRSAVVAASLTGLALGVWHTRVHGPAPVFGPLPAIWERALQTATVAPGRFAFILSKALERMEWGLDRAGRTVGHAALALAQADARVEQRLDGAAQSLGQTTLVLASASDTTERRGFSSMLDQFASLFGLAGERLRNLQSGKLYLYTLGIFIWLLAAGVVGVLAWR